MARAERTVLPVETQYDAQRHPVADLLGVNLRLDALGDLERADLALSTHAPHTRPGIRRLLTERRDAMRALAAELAPRYEDVPWQS